MEYTQTSFNRLMGPTAQISAGGGGAKILGSSGGGGGGRNVSLRRKALEERRIAESLDPMLREERISREGVAGVIRGMRESRAQQRESFFRTPSAQMQGLREGSPSGEAAWKYDQAMRGTGEGRGILLNQIMSMDPNDPMRRVYQNRLTKATQAAERQW
jgi:hypothetical protein